MRRTLPYVMLIPAVAASFFWWRAEQGRRAALVRLAQFEAARGQVGEAPVTPPATAEAPNEPISATSKTRVVRVPTGADPVPYLKTIDELRELIKEQAKDLSAARDAASRADAATATEEAERKKVKAQLDDLRDDMQAAKRLSEALQAELRVKSERLVKAETQEKLMQERLVRSETATAKVAVASKEIEDLNRRREAFLTSLLRRYREVNDLYRNFTLNAQTRETPGTGLQAGDLSRIQTAIQQAEDDLRQLQALNARMAQLAVTK
ncbi:MAG: hypothetical protein ACKV2U_00180 [Bryobacteraceae bacterium]